METINATETMKTITGTKGDLVTIINGLFGVQALKGKKFSLVVSKNIALLKKELQALEDAGKPSDEFMAIAEQVNTIANENAEDAKEQIEKLKAVETFKMDEQLKRLFPQADDDWLDAVRKGAGKEGSFSSDDTLTKALAPRARAEEKAINPSLTKTSLDEVKEDQNDFKIGYTIVTLSKENGRKVIIEKTATDIFVREDLPVF